MMDKEAGAGRGADQSSGASPWKGPSKEGTGVWESQLEMARVGKVVFSFFFLFFGHTGHHVGS